MTLSWNAVIFSLQMEPVWFLALTTCNIDSSMYTAQLGELIFEETFFF
jgi:hypothetical protein